VIVVNDSTYGSIRAQQELRFPGRALATDLVNPDFVSLAEAFVANTDVAREFNALWKDAATAPDETMLLSILNGTEVVYVAARNGARPLGLAFNVGMRLPAHLAGI